MNECDLANDIILAIIVHYKTPQLVISGLDALARERDHLPGLSVLVVDNCSGDDSVQGSVSTLMSLNMTSGPKSSNLNIMEGSLTETISVSKSPVKCTTLSIIFGCSILTTEVLEGAALELVKFLRVNPGCIAGSRLEDRDSTVQVSALIFPP